MDWLLRTTFDFDQEEPLNTVNSIPTDDIWSDIIQNYAQISYIAEFVLWEIFSRLISLVLAQ